MELYGGIPRCRRVTITTAGVSYGAPVDPSASVELGKTNYLEVANVGANELRVFFTKADFEADTNYRTVPTTAGALNPFKGPVSLEDNSAPYSQPLLWLKSNGGDTTAEIVFYYRRS